MNEPERDPIDVAARTTERWLQQAIDAHRSDIPKGVPGDCELCGEESPRLIKGACARCRDKYNLG